MTTPRNAITNFWHTGYRSWGPVFRRQSRVSQAVVRPIKEVKIVVLDLNNLGNCYGDVPVVHILAKAQGHVQFGFLCSRTKTTVTSTAA